MKKLDNDYDLESGSLYRWGGKHLGKDEDLFAKPFCNDEERSCEQGVPKSHATGKCGVFFFNEGCLESSKDKCKQYKTSCAAEN